MKLYFIRQKSTGYYMPEPVGRAGRGGSHCEPNANSDNARIFRTARAAKNALIAWLRGKYVARRGSSSSGPDFIDEYYEDIEVIPVPSRNKDDMEVVEIEVNL